MKDNGNDSRYSGQLRKKLQMCVMMYIEEAEKRDEKDSSIRDTILCKFWQRMRTIIRTISSDGSVYVNG